MVVLCCVRRRDKECSGCVVLCKDFMVVFVGYLGSSCVGVVFIIINFITVNRKNKNKNK